MSSTVAKKVPGNFGGKYRMFTGNTLIFYTDLYDSYADVIPEKQHVRVTKRRPA